MQLNEKDDQTNVSFPATYLVIQFQSNVPVETVNWLVNKIRNERKYGGGDLLARKQPSLESGCIIHISATLERFLEVAEELEVRKIDKTGLLRNFAVKDIHEFLDDTEDAEELLTTAERHNIVQHEIENIRALPGEKHIRGYKSFQLYEGQSIIQACLHWNVIRQMFPLHEPESIRKLGASWYKEFFRKQPYDQIHAYFGEAIALYFHFLGFYNCALFVPMLLGFYQMFCSPKSLAFFCVFNVLWATGFMEVWRMKSAELAYKWGTIITTSLDDEPRLGFIGHMGLDEVTGRLQPQYPRSKTLVKMYCVSFPIVLLCMIGAFLVMLATFWFEEILKNNPDIPELMVYIPSGIYCGLISVMNKYYRRLATYLTEWENHKTQTQFDRYRVTKLILFEFINNFMSLFYIAFYLQDMDLLRTQLMMMLIILQVIFNIKESLGPMIIKYTLDKLSGPRKIKVISSVNERETKQSDDNIPELDAEDSRIQQVETEVNLEVYEGTYDDYLELFVQFGYVFLFASVYPMAAFWAFFNNFIEIRSDAFKLCVVCQRPMASRVKDIGAWQRAFEALCAMSIVTNCALLFISPSLKETVAGGMNSFEWLLTCVIFEHLLFVIRQVMYYVIPDKPRWIRIALAKTNYQSRQALKKQKLN